MLYKRRCKTAKIKKDKHELIVSRLSIGAEFNHLGWPWTPK